MTDAVAPNAPLPLGNQQPWATKPIKDLINAEEPGNVAVLMAVLQRVASIEEPTLDDWEGVKVVMGDVSFKVGNDLNAWAALTAKAMAIKDAYKRYGLWEDSGQGYGVGAWVPLTHLHKYYENTYVTGSTIVEAAKDVFMVESVAQSRLQMRAWHRAKREAAKYLLNTVLLKQPRYVEAAIEDGYPSIYDLGSRVVKDDPGVQLAAGIRGHAPAAIAALRSMLLASGSEKPGLIRRFLKDALGLGPTVVPLGQTKLSVAYYLNEQALALARANPVSNESPSVLNAEIQELAQRLSAFLYRPEGKLSQLDRAEYLDDNKRKYWEGRSLHYDSRDDVTFYYEGGDDLPLASKRHKAATASLVAFFGRTKVEQMRLFVHGVGGSEQLRDPTNENN